MAEEEKERKGRRKDGEALDVAEREGVENTPKIELSGDCGNMLGTALIRAHI